LPKYANSTVLFVHEEASIQTLLRDRMLAIPCGWYLTVPSSLHHPSFLVKSVFWAFQNRIRSSFACIL